MTYGYGATDHKWGEIVEEEYAFEIKRGANYVPNWSLPCPKDPRCGRRAVAWAKQR